MVSKYEEIKKSDCEELFDSCRTEKLGFVKLNPTSCILPLRFCDIEEQILNFSIRSDDVWLLSFPRAGSTWLQEMVWLLGQDLDYDGAKNVQQIRTPLLELSVLYEEQPLFKPNSVDYVNELPSPRYIKSHLNWSLLPKQLDTVKPKIIYIARNPKDVSVSFYNYSKLMHDCNISFESFCDLLLSDMLVLSPMWSHILHLWHKRNESNILFLKYETMKRNLSDTIRLCAKFLNVDQRINDIDIERLCDHLEFGRMQENPAVNLEFVLSEGRKAMNGNGNGLSAIKSEMKFIRKGEIGDWKNYMSDELSNRFDKWIDFHTKGTGLTFEYE